MAGNQTVGARLRVVIAPGIGIGPGKAALLEGIRETGSIAAAGRRIGMSYKRAWLLVAALNSHFAEPLISANKGGKAGGGAALTALGEQVLTAYREMQAVTELAIAPAIARLAARLGKPMEQSLPSTRPTKARKAGTKPGGRGKTSARTRGD